MTTKTNYRVITDAELLDEALDFDRDSIVYELAMRMNRLQIQNGFIDDSDYFAQFNDDQCPDCEINESAVDEVKGELSKLLDAIKEDDKDYIQLTMRMHGKG